MKGKCLLITLVLGLGLTMALLWLSSGLGTGPPVARAADLHVCPSGCTYSSIQAAVDAASDGDVIKVATGIYTGVNNYGVLVQVVYINKSVTIRGGYTAAFTDPPDSNSNPTTLDAQGQGRVLYITGNISPTIEGLRITGGDATGLDGNGGGVYISNATATIRNNQVFSNTAQWGGGLHLYDSAATLSGNTVISNTANQGGGLFLWFSDNATLSSNTVISNTANDAGGGLYLMNSDATLSGNTVSANTVPHGGGLYLMHSDATLSGNTILSNTAIGQGGGLWLDFSDATLTNNVVADNRANGGGSGLLVWSSSPRLLHTTVARNGGGDGSGLYVADDGSKDSTVAMTNTILVSHTVGIYVSSGNTATLEGTLWGSGAWANIADWGGAGTVVTGTVNIRGDPAFVDADNGDYHIGPGSAALDKGVDAGVSTDIDNEPRFYEDPDLGADEYWPPGARKRIYLPLVRKSH